ncbi:MAG: hypothetical protein AAF138_11610, partial [Planctomycetota bacterium]
GERAEELGPVRVSASARIKPGRHDRTPLWHKSWIRIDRVWTSDGVLLVDSPGPAWTDQLDRLAFSLFTDPSVPFLASAAEGARFSLPPEAVDASRIAGELTRFEVARIVERSFPIEQLTEARGFVQITPGAWITARHLFDSGDATTVTIRTWTSPNAVPPPFAAEFSVALDSWEYEDDSLTGEAEFAAQSWAMPHIATIQLLDDAGDIATKATGLSLGWHHRNGMLQESPLSFTLKPGRRLANIRVWVVTEHRIVTEPFDVTIEETVKYRRSLVASENHDEPST